MQPVPGVAHRSPISSARATRSGRGTTCRSRSTRPISRGPTRARPWSRRPAAIDILINNAGAIPKGDLLELDDARWREAWDLKVFGYINMCRDFYRGMQARKSGVIINIIGFSSEKLDYDYLAGSTGNAGLVAFTRALGSLSIEYGVRVLGVNPGYVETERAVRGLRIRAEKELGDPEKWPDLVRDLWPRGKMITPKEIADVVAFLASDRASAICGQIVTVDAGFASRSYGRRVSG